MDREGFWKIIETARTQVGNPVVGAQDVAAAVVDGLAALPTEHIIGFQLQFEALQKESYRWDLWAAAYLVRQGCSDDSFDYFRGWLIAQGREAWEAALGDPDSLADVVDIDTAMDDGVVCEEMLGAAATAYERATADEEGFWSALGSASAHSGVIEDSGPAGEDFDFDDEDEMRARLPRLSALFLESDE